MPLTRLPRWFALTLPLLVLALFGLGLLRVAFAAPPSVSYTEFKGLLEAGQVERVVVRGERAEVTLAPPADTVRVDLPRNQTLPAADLLTRLERAGVDYRFEAPRQWLVLALNLLPILLLVLVPAALLAALLILLARRPQSRQP